MAYFTIQTTAFQKQKELVFRYKKNYGLVFAEETVSCHLNLIKFQGWITPFKQVFHQENQLIASNGKNKGKEIQRRI